MLNLAVNGNATTSDHVKVEKILNNIGSIYQIEEVFSELQMELATFQTPEQLNYTMNFYQELKGTLKTSKIAMVSTKCMSFFGFYHPNTFCVRQHIIE